jgi:GDP-L-fucose synthase
MKIIVTGSSGLVGMNLKNMIIPNQNHNYIFLSSKDCDLKDRQSTLDLFKKHKPDYIIHLAANVGGLYKNLIERTAMFTDNVRINENVLEACNTFNVNRGIFCLSSCVYPCNPSKFPMDESMLHESPPHESNQGYAYSKRMLEMQCKHYNEKYNREYICLIPVNLYGSYDNFSSGSDSHVLPSLVHKLYNAKNNNENFTVYGTGKALRQFLYAEDFAKIIIKVLFEYKNDKSIIISNDEITIKELINIIAKTINFNNSIEHDITKSDGCLKKL